MYSSPRTWTLRTKQSRERVPTALPVLSSIERTSINGHTSLHRVYSQEISRLLKTNSSLNPLKKPPFQLFIYPIGFRSHKRESMKNRVQKARKFNNVISRVKVSGVYLADKDSVFSIGAFVSTYSSAERTITYHVRFSTTIRVYPERDASAVTAGIS